jgi:hypothetical protein
MSETQNKNMIIRAVYQIIHNTTQCLCHWILGWVSGFAQSDPGETMIPGTLEQSCCPKIMIETEMHMSNV